MNFFALSGLINGITSTVFGLFVLIKARARRNTLYFIYVLFCFSVAIWSYFYFAWQIAKSASEALLYSRGLMAGAIFIPIFYLHHILHLIGIAKEKKKIIINGYIFAVLFLSFSFTPYFVRSVSSKLQFQFWPNPGIAYHFFLPIWLFFVLYGVFMILKSYKRASGFKRNQFKYLLLATLCGWGGGATNFPLWYDIKIPPFGNILVSAYIIITAYAIVRYQLMDIKLALTRAGLIFLVYSFVLGVPFWLGSRMLDQQGWWFPVILMGLLATGGPFIYNYLRRGAEDILLCEQKRYQRALKDFSSTLIFIRDIKELSQKVVAKIMDSVRLDFCALYLKQDDAFYLKSEESMNHPQLPSKVDIDNEFINAFKEANTPVLGDYLPKLENMKLGLVSPLFLNQNLYGFIALGPKTKDTFFTDTDIDVFSIVSNQTSLALSEIYYFEQYQKATEEKYKLLVEKERLESAFQISEAYRHELGNILNVISTSLSNLMFIGDYIPSKEDIEQTRKSISSNVKKAQKIFNAIGKYNENSKSEFKEARLDEILNEAIEEQKETFSKSNIRLKTDIENNVKISANNNFLFSLRYFFEGAVGAIEYTNPKERLIAISLESDDIGVRLEISDTGQDATADRLYKGVGIERAKEGGILYFIARRIIFDHQGKLKIAPFDDGKGTSFIIEIPLLKGGA